METPNTNYDQCAQCDRRLDPRVERVEPVTCGICQIENRQRSYLHILDRNNSPLCGSQFAEKFVSTEAHHPDCSDLTDCPPCQRAHQLLVELGESHN